MTTGGFVWNSGPNEILDGSANESKACSRMRRKRFHDPVKGLGFTGEESDSTTGCCPAVTPIPNE